MGKPKVRSTAYPPDPPKDYNDWATSLFKSNHGGTAVPPHKSNHVEDKTTDGR